MGWEGDVDFDGKSDAVGTVGFDVDFFEDDFESDDLLAASELFLPD